MTSPVDNILLPLPRKGISHAVILFERMPDNVMTRLTQNLQKSCYPRLQPLDPKRWGTVQEPRPISFGELDGENSDQGWNKVPRWHLLLDGEGVAPEVVATIESGPVPLDERSDQKLKEAGASILVFLLSDGEDLSTPLSKVKALGRVVWELMALGASAVAFPEGGTFLHSETLSLLPVEELASGHSYLFVSSALLEKSQGNFWFRTYGMAQFALPDLFLRVPELDEQNPELLDQELTRARLLLETLPAEMIGAGGVLPIGGEASVGPRLFRAVPPPENRPHAVSRFGFSFLE